MAATVLKPGSKGTLVTILQKALNAKGKLSNPIDVDGTYGPDTVEAVRAFQKRSGIKVDGTVGAETANALGKLLGPSGNAFVNAFGPAEDSGNGAEDRVTITLGGKTGTLTKKEFDDLRNQTREALRRGASAAEQKAVAAREMWIYFRDLNKEQYIVGWCVGLLGPKLPDEGLIKEAEGAVKRFKETVNGTDFDKMADALKDLDEPVRKAGEAMKKYQEGVIGRAEGWVTGLEFTSDVSFEVVKALGKFESGGKGGPLIDGAADGVKRLSLEVGKAIAGTSKGLGDAVKNVAVDAVVSAGLSKVLADGGKCKQIIEGVAEKVAAKVAKGWFSSASREAIEALVKKWLETSGEKVLQSTVKETAKLITGDTQLGEFCDKLAVAIAGSFVLGAFEPWIDRKLPETAYKELIRQPGLAKLFDVEERIGLEVLRRELLVGAGSKLVEKGLGELLKRAKGDERPEEMGKILAESIVDNPEFKAVLAAAAKKVKTR